MIYPWSRLSLLILSAILATGCKRNPVDRLVNPNPDGVLPQSSGVFTIYDDELKTGGGLGLLPGGENQSIDLGDRSSPRRTDRQLRYSWNGGDVFNAETGAAQHLFAGFSLLVTPDFSTFASASGKNLSSASYAALSFFIRGSLASGTTLRVEGPDDGTGGITPARLDISSLSSDWQELSFAVPAGDFSSVKSFITVTFQYEQPPRTTAPGEGGVVYFDDIRYVR